MFFQVFHNVIVNNMLKKLTGYRSQRDWPVVGGMSPFVKIGTTTRASRQSSGISPRSRDSWNRVARAGASSSAAAFNMNAGTESEPVALWVSRFFKSLCMPFKSTLISGISGVVLGSLSGMLV